MASPTARRRSTRSSASSRGRVCLTSFGSIRRRSTATFAARCQCRGSQAAGVWILDRLRLLRGRDRRASYANRDPFGYGRPITTSIEYTQRSYKGEILYEDPYLFNTDFALQARLSALTFDYVGYSKFEVGGRVILSRQITDKYSIGFVYSGRHVEITDASIKQPLLGPTSYFVSAIGFTQTLDLRKNPLVAPRGFVFDNTLDFASSAIGSQIDLFRTTGRASYYLSFAPDELQLTGEDLQKSSFQKWFERSLLAFGGRAGIVYPLDTSGRQFRLCAPDR